MARARKTADDLVTVSQFYRLVPDGQKADLIDGIIHMASPDTRKANRRANFIQFLLEGYTAARDIGGEVFASRFAFRLSRYRAPEPDVAYVLPERLHLVEEREMRGGPDVAVEIVSRDSRSRDYGEKKRLCQKAKVKEYWIIDPGQKRAEFHRLRNGTYQLASREENCIFRSAVIPGFWLNVNWLFAKPLPNAFRCLMEILGAP